MTGRPRRGSDAEEHNLLLIWKEFKDYAGVRCNPCRVATLELAVEWMQPEPLRMRIGLKIIESSRDPVSEIRVGPEDSPQPPIEVARPDEPVHQSRRPNSSIISGPS